MSTIRIRRAMRSDFPAITALQIESWRDAYASFLPPSYLKERVVSDLQDTWNRAKIKSQDVVLVAEDPDNEDQLSGFIAVWCRPNPYIDNLHCAPAQVSKGIGRALMKRAFEQLLFDNHTSVALSVIAENKRARQFYLKLGGHPSKQYREELFGHPVAVEKMIWSNLNVCQNW